MRLSGFVNAEILALETERDILDKVYAGLAVLSDAEMHAQIESMSEEAVLSALGDQSTFELVQVIVDHLSHEEIFLLMDSLTATAKARIWHALGNVNKALSELEPLVVGESKEIAAEACFERAVIFLYNNVFDLARLDFQRALEMGYDQGECYWGMGEVRKNIGDYDGAESYYTDAMRFGSSKGVRSLALLNKKRGHYEMAVKILKGEIDTNPQIQTVTCMENLMRVENDYNGLLELYICLLKRGDGTSLMKVNYNEFKKADPKLLHKFAIEAGKWAVNSGEISGYGNIALFLIEAGIEESHEEVMKILDGMIDLNEQHSGNSADASRAAGIIYMKRNDNAKAIPYLFKAEDMGSKHALVDIADTMREIGGLRLAEKYYWDAIKTDNERIFEESLLGLMSMYEKGGEIKKLAGLKEALSKNGRALTKDMDELLELCTMKASSNYALLWDRKKPEMSGKNLTN